MNWQEIYLQIRTLILVGSLSIVGGGTYSFIVAEVCRVVFKLNENVALIWIGGPLFFALTTWFIISLPKHLRKVGLIE